VRILVVTFYYRPDLSAGSFRVTAVVDALRRRMPSGGHIDVVTTMPNRYRSFAVQAPAREELPGVSIERLVTPQHESGMLDQSSAFLGFARSAMAFAKPRSYDLVFATSGRLMTAVLGTRIARVKRAKLYLDIRDIFADTIKDVLRGPKGRVADRVFSVLEAYAMHRADRVNLVSAGFLDYFQGRYPAQRFSCFTNGIDDEFVAAAPTRRSPSPRLAGPDTVTILYAGNVGEGQGLHHIVPQLASTLGARVRFRIIGDGGRVAALRQAIASAGVDNVEILSPMGRPELIEAYRTSDVLFLHLNDYQAFTRVLPSKIFELAAMGKPIWAGVAGFSARFLADHVSNTAIFRPCDIAGALRAFGQLTLEDAPRTAFLAEFSRGTISSRLADDILAVTA
jgi:glycosyltransferase involved in cell wall biosynthesis